MSHTKNISLDGTWSLRSTSGYRSVNKCPVTVPGTVQEAMEKYTGDVYSGHGCLNSRWIEEMLWYYERSFVLDESDLSQSIRIVFEGLDLTAKIFINNAYAGTHNNFYTPCRLDIKPFVHAGENHIRVELESGLRYASDKEVSDVYPGPWDHGNALHKRQWLRKVQSSFEWDWSPRVVNVGIYKPCRIEITSGLFFDEYKILTDVTEDYSAGNVSLTAYVSSHADKSECRMAVKIKETGENAEANVTLGTGAGSVTVSLNVASPKLWYPRNYGEQNLYTVEFTLYRGDEIIAVCEKKIGFRKVVIDQSKHPRGGQYFIINVNGTNVFAKGANMVPADILYSKLSRDVYETLISRACEANFNALRVWGGGLYETEDFYDLCSEHGIMVWQDFMGACANYPGYNNEFFKNFRREAEYQIRRLSRFPSLVILSGNNEIDWQSRNMYDNDLSKYPDAGLYYCLIPELLCREGFNCFYQPSSPWSPDFSYANNDLIGDQHPWDVGFANKDYFYYRNYESRFPNEGGTLGSTSLPNTMDCLSEGEEYIHSFDWELHSNSIEQIFPQSALLSEKLGISSEGLSIPEFVYYAGLCQGEGLTEYILNFRRRMYDTASAIFWMYNDCWPATTSWTVVDYRRARTPSFYPVKRAFAPVTVDIVKDKNTDKYIVYGINERLYEVPASLEYGSFTPCGKYETCKTDVVLKPNASVVLAEFSCDGDVIPYAELCAKDEPAARRRFIERAYNTLGLQKCDIDITYEEGCVVFAASKFVMGVCIDLDGIETGDNFFDLYPGKPYRVRTDRRDIKIINTYFG